MNIYYIYKIYIAYMKICITYHIYYIVFPGGNKRDRSTCMEFSKKNYIA